MKYNSLYVDEIMLDVWERKAETALEYEREKNDPDRFDKERQALESQGWQFAKRKEFVDFSNLVL